MIKKLPLIELRINPDDDSFVSAISLVENPAVESSFIAFSNKKNYQFADDEKRELIGIAMKANTAIYRNDPQIGEYSVAFSADTIRLIAQTFFQKNLSKAMNLEHSKQDAESFIFQSYIVDSEKGMFAPKGINDANDGDWIVGTKVLSDKVWADVKAGKFTGYSVEGFFIPHELNEFIDVQMKKADAEMLQFMKELDSDLDAMITQLGI